MAVSKTTRFGVTRWTEDTDPWSRDDFDDDNAAVEAKAAGFLEGTAAARPAASAANARMFYRATDTDMVSYSTGAAWMHLTPETFEVAIALGSEVGAGWVKVTNTGFVPPLGSYPAWMTRVPNTDATQAGALEFVKGLYLVTLAARITLSDYIAGDVIGIGHDAAGGTIVPRDANVAELTTNVLAAATAGSRFDVALTFHYHADDATPANNRVVPFLYRSRDDADSIELVVNVTKLR